MSSDARNGTCPDGQTGNRPARQAETRVDESVGDFQPETCPALTWWARRRSASRGAPLRLKRSGHWRAREPARPQPQAPAGRRAPEAGSAGEGARCPPPRVPVARRRVGPLEPLPPQRFSLRTAALGPPQSPQPHTRAPAERSASAQRAWRRGGEEAPEAPEVVRPGPPWWVGPQEADAGRVRGQAWFSTSEASESGEVCLPGVSWQRGG